MLLPLVEPAGICDVSEECESDVPVFVLLVGAPGDAPMLEFERELDLVELELPEVELLTPNCCAVSESSRPVTLMFLDC